jgi:hypothetical protein
MAKEVDLEVLAAAAGLGAAWLDNAEPTVARFAPSAFVCDQRGHLSVSTAADRLRRGRQAGDVLPGAE